MAVEMVVTAAEAAAGAVGNAGEGGAVAGFTLVPLAGWLAR